MSTPFPGPAWPPVPSYATPPPVPRRRRPMVIAAVALGSVATVTAIALGATAVWGGGPHGSKTSTTIAAPDASPSEEPTEPTETDEPSEPTTDYTVTPTQTWRVTASDLMAGDQTAYAALAAPDPLDRPTVQDVVVVTVGTQTLSSIIGLDRETGDEVWRTDLDTSTACQTLGTGSSTMCLDSSNAAADGTYRVLTVDTASGAVEGEDTIGFLPFTATEIDGELILSGSDPTGTLHTTCGTSTDLDARWHATSDEGYVAATDYSSGFAVSDGTIWSSIGGATMVVDLSTGDAESMSAASGLSSAPWPGGFVLEFAGLTLGAPSTTVTAPGGTPFTEDGYGWSRLGASTEMESVVGIGVAAYDPENGTELWSATPDPTALGTSFTAVDDLAIEKTWWEESITLTARDLRTGEERWQSSIRSGSQRTREGDTLLADSSYGIEALHLDTGERLWELDYTDLMTTDASTYTTVHTIAGASLVMTFDDLITGYTFEP